MWQSLLEHLILVTILFVATLGIKKVLKNKLSPVLHLAVWAILLLKLCVPFMLESGFHLIVYPTASGEQTEIIAQNNYETSNYHIETVPQLSVTDNEIQDNTNGFKDQQKDESLKNPSIIEQWEIAQEQKIATPTHVPQTFIEYFVFHWETILLLTWSVGVFCFGVKLFYAYYLLHKRVVRDAILANGIYLTMLNRCKRELKIYKSPLIYFSSDISTPSLTIGRKPKILMPFSMIESNTNEEIYYSIKHELAHYKRKDHLLYMLLQVLEIMYWFFPIVKIASNIIKKDIEVACDSKVTESMVPEGVKKYAITLLHMFKGTRKSFVLGMAFGNTEKVAEQRIRGVFMKRKTKKSVKWVCALFAVIMGIMCFTTACQPTPESEIVAGKNDGELEQKIEADPVDMQDINVPSTIQENISAYDGKLEVNIDANVYANIQSDYPVLSIRKIEKFDRQQIEAIITALMGNAQMIGIPSELSQNELEERYLQLKKEYEDLKNGNTDSNSDGGSSLEEYENMLSELEAQMATAPEEVKQETVTVENYLSDNMLYATADVGRSEKATIRITDGTNIDWRIGDGYYCEAISDINTVSPSVKGISKEDAILQAEDLVAKMGFSDLTATGIGVATKGGDEFEIESGTNQAISVCFTRKYNEITAFPVSLDSYVGDGEYAATVPKESLIVTVDESGIATVNYQGAAEIVEEKNANVEMVAFDEIIERCETQLSVNNAYMEDDFVKATRRCEHYNIETIVLGYVEIPEQNNADSVLFVPAWKFYGNSTTEYDENGLRVEYEKMGLSESEIENRIDRLSENSLQEGQTFLTINAIDGSIIEN